MWQTVIWITTPISLVALLFVIFYKIKAAQIKNDLDKLKTVNANERAELLPVLEGKYDLRPKDLTKDQRFELMKTELEDRTQRRKEQFGLAWKLSLLFFAFLIIALFVNRPSKGTTDDPVNPAKNDSVDNLSNVVIPSEVNSKDRSVLTTDVSVPKFNIVDSSNAIKLLFGSKILNRTDTITTPASITSGALLTVLLKDYDLQTIIARNIPWADSIRWHLVHERARIQPDLLSRPVAELKWKNMDNIALEYDVNFNRTAKIISDRPLNPREIRDEILDDNAALPVKVYFTANSTNKIDIKVLEAFIKDARFAKKHNLDSIMDRVNRNYPAVGLRLQKVGSDEIP